MVSPFPPNPFRPTETFHDPDAALARIAEIYDTAIAHLREGLHRYVAGEDFGQRVRAHYPFIRIETDTAARPDSRLAYGFLAGPGHYETTLTRPDLFADYYREQLQLLMANHPVGIQVGTSRQPIPVHFRSVNPSTSSPPSIRPASCA